MRRKGTHDHPDEFLPPSTSVGLGPKTKYMPWSSTVTETHLTNHPSFDFPAVHTQSDGASTTKTLQLEVGWALIALRRSEVRGLLFTPPRSFRALAAFEVSANIL
jgi:hypothetical protein